MSSFKNVTLVGAGGNVGPGILKALLASKFNVTVLTRAGSSSSTFEGVPSENVISGEYTPEFFRKALKGQDALVLAIGSAALEAQKDVITAAAEVGVKRIIPSEFGGDITNPASLKAIPFNDGKLVVAKHLEETVAAHPETSWTAVVCGPFFDWCLAVGLLGIDIQNHKATLYDQGTNRFDSTNIDTVGKAVASILSKPDKFANERLFISGMVTSQVDILNAVKKATGSEEWAVDHKTSAELRGVGYERLGKGDFAGIGDVISASLFEDGCGSLYSSERKLANDELGVHDDLDASVQSFLKSAQK